MKRTHSHGSRRLTRSVTPAAILLMAVVTLWFSYRTWLHSSAPQSTGDDVALFSDVTDTLELKFVHDAGGAIRYFMPAIMSGGVALFDFDLDGDLDIYFVNGAGVHSGSVSDEGPRNVLYRQEADGRFVDVTADSGLGDRGYGMGVAIGDVNNDGYPDVYNHKLRSRPPVSQPRQWNIRRCDRVSGHRQHSLGSFRLFRRF